MRVSFPHMGNSHIAIKCLLENLGAEVVVPPRINRRTLELGVRYSPEGACLPFKINLGNFLESIELGAEALLMLGGFGACRFGYYGEMQKKILRDLGYQLEFVIMDPQLWFELWKGLRKVSDKFSFLQFCTAFYLAWEKMKKADILERFLLTRRAHQKIRGEVEELYRVGIQLIELSSNPKELKIHWEEISKKAEKISWGREVKPLKIGVIGEIYMVMEPAANLNLEKILGDRGVEVIRSFYLSDWIKQNVVLRRMLDKRIKKVASPYLAYGVCGHGQENIAETILYAQAGMDGIIHLAPFGCMPEIVAKSILPSISRDIDIPLLYFSLDEHAGEAGIVTRIEAFLDLLERRRQDKAISY